jgi:hypothetical protein
MKQLIISLILILSTAAAFAAEFYCSSTPRIRVAQLGESVEVAAATGSAKNARRGRYRLERFDVLQAYSGQPVLLGHTWLTACMMPPTHPDTRNAFASLVGVSPDASAAMANATGLVDRGIRITLDMKSCLADNAPAVGYSSTPIDSEGIKLCF